MAPRPRSALRNRRLPGLPGYLCRYLVLPNILEGRMPEDLVPTTRWEDETVGGAADEVKKEAMSAAESAKDVAGATARAAKEEAERQDGEGQFEDSAREIAGRATEEAKERAHEENLDSDGIKRRASEAGDRVRKRADE